MNTLELLKGFTYKLPNCSPFNGIKSLEEPTEEKPWFTFKAESCTLSSMIDMHKLAMIKEEEVVNEHSDREVDAKLVKELRGITRRGVMECKIALQETNGNINEAIKLLKIRS